MISIDEYFKDSEATGIELLFLTQSGQAKYEKPPHRPQPDLQSAHPPHLA